MWGVKIWAVMMQAWLPSPTSAVTAAATRRLFHVQRACCCSSSTAGKFSTSLAAVPPAAGAPEYRFRPDGHPSTAHADVTAAHALGIVHEIIGRCRSLAVLTTHAQAGQGCAGQGCAGLTSRVVGVRFDQSDGEEASHPDLRRAAIGTNPQTRKAAELAADGRLTFTFFSNESEGVSALMP